MGEEAGREEQRGGAGGGADETQQRLLEGQATLTFPTRLVVDQPRCEMLDVPNSGGFRLLKSFSLPFPTPKFFPVKMVPTDVENKRLDTKGGKQRGRWGCGGVMNWAIGIDMYTLMCIKWMTNKNLLYKKNKIIFKNSKKKR